MAAVLGLPAFENGAGLPSQRPRESDSVVWLLRLRWIALAVQTLVIVLAYSGFVPLEAVGMYAAVALVTLSTNALGHRIVSRAGDEGGDGLAVVLLTVDILLLTVLLSFAGGPTNPLVILYIVHIALAAVMVPPAWAWTLTALVVIAYGLLFLSPVPRMNSPAVPPSLASDPAFVQHTLDLWWAFVGVAVLLTHFVTRVTRALIERERQLGRAQEWAARVEKLASLATLATGAAHELGTPLGTIGLVAREVERGLEKGAAPESLRGDIQLIISEVGRCRSILDSMRSGAGRAGENGEPLGTFAVRELVEEARQNMRPDYRGRVRLNGQTDESIRGPHSGLVHVLQNLMENGLDASAAGEDVSVSVTVEKGTVRIDVDDRGSGIESGALDRVGEPFFTTKEAGSGMGLGLFVSQAVVERLGGTIRLSARSGGGTRVRVELPQSRAA